MTLTQMENSLDGYNQKIISSIRNGGIISSIQSVISTIESLIGTLEKLNNVYTFFKSGGTSTNGGGLSGLWNTVKSFFGGKSTSGSFSKTVYDGMKSATNAAKMGLGSSTTGSGFVGVFQNAFSSIANSAKGLFSSSGSGGLTGIFSKGINAIGSVLGIGGGAAMLSSVPTMTMANTAGMTGLGALVAKAGIGVGAAGTGTTLAGGAALGGLSSIPVIGAIVAGVALGANSLYQGVKAQKQIWSSNDSTGTKVVKSVGRVLWDISPIGAVVNAVKSIGGWCKKIFGKQEEQVKETKKKENKTNITINATQQTLDANGNPVTSNSNSQLVNEKGEVVKKVVKTGVGVAAGAALGGMAFGPLGALAGAALGWLLGSHATGLKSAKNDHIANVDELGPELVVRKPESGRYTYLETGDGVVPADITSRLFEMGGNPDKWFNDQLSKHSTATMVQSRDSGSLKMSIGDVIIQNPVGDTDALANQIVRQLPNKMTQRLNKR